MVTVMRLKMASLMQGTLFEVNSQGPSPSKDFYQLIVTKTEVILRTWKISLRIEFRGAAPTELKEPHDDFLHDSKLQQLVSTVFGQRILQYIIGLCQGDFDYLERMPEDLLLRIMSYLPINDVIQLAKTTVSFRKLCNSEKFWEQTVRTTCVDFRPDMVRLASAMGWRKFYSTLFSKEKH